MKLKVFVFVATPAPAEVEGWGWGSGVAGLLLDVLAGAAELAASSAASFALAAKPCNANHFINRIFYELCIYVNRISVDYIRSGSIAHGGKCSYLRSRVSKSA